MPRKKLEKYTSQQGYIKLGFDTFPLNHGEGMASCYVCNKPVLSPQERHDLLHENHWRKIPETETLLLISADYRTGFRLCSKCSNETQELIRELRIRNTQEIIVALEKFK